MLSAVSHLLGSASTADERRCTDSPGALPHWGHGFLTIIDGGTFELAGGTLSLASIDAISVEPGGIFNWLSGTIQLNSFTLDGSAGVLGPALTLGPGQTLEVLGRRPTTTVLTLAGGRLITETIEGPGALVLDSGELRYTRSSGLMSTPPARWVPT